MIEKLSIASRALPGARLENDLETCVEAGLGGCGIWEPKLPPSADAALVAHFAASGLRATLAMPAVSTILPTSGASGPAKPSARTDAICTSVRRLAAFDPTAVLCAAGPSGELEGREARAIVVGALRRIARTAATARIGELLVGLEPSHPSLERDASIVSSLAGAAELVADVGEPNLGIVLDTWHLGDSADLVESVAKHADLIIGVQVSDRPAAPSSPADRAIPGEGVLDLRIILGALESAAYGGWYELEVSSRELSAVELARRCKQAFRGVWSPRISSAHLDES